MDFYCRNAELEVLGNALKAKTYPNAIVYGRRRVGKSEIIKQFAASSACKVVSFQCVKSSNEDNLLFLSRIVGEAFDDEFARFDSLDEIYAFLTKKVKEKPIILIIDEYPFWREIFDGLDSILQRCLDKVKDERIMTIVCGSAMSVMESISDYKAPLHGRFSQKLFVEPFDYYDSSLFYNRVSQEDKIAYYSCFSGLPFLLTFIDQNKSFEQNIIDNYLSFNAPIPSFIETTIKEEISKEEFAHAILLSIASNNRKYQDILNASHVPSNVQMDRVLEKLIQLKIVKKEYPINEQSNKKKTIYSIADNAISFYYRYVFPRLSYLMVMNPKDFFQRFVKDDLYTQFIPHQFETIGKEFLIRMNKKGLLDKPFCQVGKYFYDLPKEKRNGELDVVTCDDDGYRSYEAKYKDRPLGDDEIDNLIKKAKSVPEIKINRFGFFSKSGYESKDKIAANGFYSLGDFFKENL